MKEDQILPKEYRNLTGKDRQTDFRTELGWPVTVYVSLSSQVSVLESLLGSIVTPEAEFMNV